MPIALSFLTKQTGTVGKSSVYELIHLNLARYFHILLDVLKKDNKASFFFIGAEDERDVLGSSTRRFKVYFRFVTSIVSDRLFAHFPVEDESLYILVNKEAVEDRTSYASHIISLVKQEYSHR